jgi:hypothetical protein
MTFSFDQKIPYRTENDLSGKLRPSGRFSLVQIFRKKTKRVMSHDKEIQAPQALHTVSQLDDTYAKLIGGDFSPLREVPTGSPDDSGGFGLSDGAISPIRSKRGSKGINPRQRDLVCWGAATLERIYHRANLSFLTYTLPDLTAEDLVAIKENWADIVNRVQLRIKEKLNGLGIKTAIVGCVELQLERAENTGVIYPHLHLVFRGRRDNRSDWAIKPHQFRQIWRRCCGKFLSSEKYSWNASENVEQVKRSVAGYLAKYISKCASKVGDGMLSAWHPRDWIFIGRRIRALYESSTLSGEYISEMLDKVIRTWHPSLGYVNSVFIQSPAYGDRRIGYCGWLRGEVYYPSYQELHPYVAPVVEEAPELRPTLSVTLEEFIKMQLC